MAGDPARRPVPDGTFDELASLAAVPAPTGTIEVVAPFDAQPVGEVPAADPSAVAMAVAGARSAQPSWQALGLDGRLDVLRRFHDTVLDRSEEILDVIQVEGGKARVAALEEILDTAATTRYYINTAPGLLKTRRRSVSLPGATTTWEVRHPIGVVGCIAPWNYPFTLAVSDMVPALIAGNAVVVKPDEKTPYSALLSARMLADSGLPEDVFQVVTGAGPEAGGALVDQVDYLMFTGSGPVGRQVAAAAGKNLIDVSLELGGKNAAIVLGDADFDVTVPGLARAIFSNAGQLCIAMERIYVEDSIRGAFTEALVEHTKSMPVIARYDFSSQVSSLITEGHLERVHGHVEDAAANGARVLTGGKPRPDIGPWFYEPTLLDGVGEGTALRREETFGPVAAIYGVSGPNEAVAAANDSEMGLNFSVWSEDVDRAAALARRLEAGTVGINDGYAATWSSYDAPMGGVKSSGISRRHGSVGLLKYTRSQTISAQRLVPALAPPAGMSYDTYAPLLTRALKVLRRLPFYK